MYLGVVGSLLKLLSSIDEERRKAVINYLTTYSLFFSLFMSDGDTFMLLFMFVKNLEPNWQRTIQRLIPFGYKYIKDMMSRQIEQRAAVRTMTLLRIGRETILSKQHDVRYTEAYNAHLFTHKQTG